MINKETPLLEIVTSSQDINNQHGEASDGPESDGSRNLEPYSIEDDAWQDGDGDPCPICSQPYKSHCFLFGVLHGVFADKGIFGSVVIFVKCGTVASVSSWMRQQLHVM